MPLVMHPVIPSLVCTSLWMAVFLLVIPSGTLMVHYMKLTGNSAAFNLHCNLQFGVGAFVSDLSTVDLPLILFFGQSVP